MSGRVGTRFSVEARLVKKERRARSKDLIAKGKGPVATWVKKSSRRNKRSKH